MIQIADSLLVKEAPRTVAGSPLKQVYFCLDSFPVFQSLSKPLFYTKPSLKFFWKYSVPQIAILYRSFHKNFFGSKNDPRSWL